MCLTLPHVPLEALSLFFLIFTRYSLYVAKDGSYTLQGTL